MIGSVVLPHIGFEFGSILSLPRAHLKTAKVYFGQGNMDQFNFGQNQTIWVKNMFRIRWENLNKLKGNQPD